MTLDFWETLQGWAEQLKNWMVDAVKNPLFLLVFIALGIVIFKLVYDSLNKNR